jgi:RNA polymerase sigma-70 factor (ECF subfamily)
MPNIKSTFDEIIYACIQRDQKARKELYDLFSAQMYSVCMRYAQNKSQADDIFQDSFLTVFEKLGELKNSEALPGWVKTIFIRTALNFNKKEMKYTSIEFVSNTYDNYVDYDILDELSLKEITAHIQKLPVKSRMVFNLYVIEGYTHQEISDIMKISVGTSKSQLFDAKKALKNLIGANSQHYLQIVV